ncbi:sensor histidine kinase [Fibrivirga algicola]|uniref:histidine kinase n=1 Tax=Fibrivirga algicola TaxID=2950420 RepID=A0ABX0QK98_9BACT|nr:ATP-binding protein [Fibrivirga algicola]NID12896.1 PAS domain-containing protein [Fibrivirga algicola]
MTAEPSPYDPDSTAAENERLTFSLQAAGVGTWDYNLQTGHAQWSAICKQLFGLSADAQVTSQILLNQVHPDDRVWVEQANRQALSPLSHGHHHIVFRTLGPGGQLRWVEAKGKTVQNEQGQTIRFSGIVQDVTQQVLTQRAIEQSEYRFRSLIEEAPLPAALLVGRELVIEFANSPQIEVWGKGHDVRGKTLAQLLPEMEGQPFLAILDEVFTTAKAYQTCNSPAELVIGGVRSTYYFDFTFKPLRNTQEQVYAILAMGVDVTQQVVARRMIEESEERYRTLSVQLDQQVQARTQQLQAYIHDLQRSNENLQQFAYIASHDLQEPLRKIQAFSTLLQKSAIDQSIQNIDYLERIQGSANRMSTLIRDLLTFSRISTQQDQSGLLALTDILQSALADLDMSIQETGATIHLDPLPMVVGDALQLSQLFQNLLSNALKFQLKGRPPVIDIRYKWVAAENLPPEILPNRRTLAYHQITVTDNGIGFDEKYKHRIFQVFQRLHGMGIYSGTGIGLAICEKVVANHGGAIMASSQLGQGAVFTIYLPA